VHYSPILCLGITILYLPIVVLIAYSFNASPLVNVWGGFSTAWYFQLLHNRQLLQAALLSLEVAVTASTAAVLLGTWRRSRWYALPAFAGACC
jgi:putrescine transport system permease protein